MGAREPLKLGDPRRLDRWGGTDSCGVKSSNGPAIRLERFPIQLPQGHCKQPTGPAGGRVGLVDCDAGKQFGASNAAIRDEGSTLPIRSRRAAKTLNSREYQSACGGILIAGSSLTPSSNVSPSCGPLDEAF